MPFDIGSTGDQRDVIQVNYLGQGSQPPPMSPALEGVLPSDEAQISAAHMLSYQANI